MTTHRVGLGNRATGRAFDSSFTPCGQRCLTQAVADADCGSLSDTQCLCENDNVNEEVFDCIANSCSDQDFDAFGDALDNCDEESSLPHTSTSHLDIKTTLSFTSTTLVPTSSQPPETSIGSSGSPTSAPERSTSVPAPPPPNTTRTTSSTSQTVAENPSAAQTTPGATTVIPDPSSSSAALSFLSFSARRTTTFPSSPVGPSTGSSSSSGTPSTTAQETQTAMQSHGPSSTTVRSLSVALGSIVLLVLIALLVLWLRCRRRRRRAQQLGRPLMPPREVYEDDGGWPNSEEGKMTDRISIQAPTSPGRRALALVPNRLSTSPGAETTIPVISAPPSTVTLCPSESAPSTPQPIDAYSSGALLDSGGAERLASDDGPVVQPGEQAASSSPANEDEKYTHVAGPEPQEELCADTHTSASASPLAGSDTVSFQPLETPQFVAVLMDLRATTDMDQPPPYLPRPPHVRLDVPHEERAIER